MPRLPLLLDVLSRPADLVPAAVVAVVLLSAVVALVVSAANARRDGRIVADLESAGRGTGADGYSPRP